MSGHCLVRVRMLHYLHAGSRTTITQLLTHTMQQRHMQKAVPDLPQGQLGPGPGPEIKGAQLIMREKKRTGKEKKK